jgi:hypothetical protein
MILFFKPVVYSFASSKVNSIISKNCLYKYFSNSIINLFPYSFGFSKKYNLSLYSKNSSKNNGFIFVVKILQAKLSVDFRKRELEPDNTNFIFGYKS